MTDTREIRGVLIPVTGGRLLLPNATVAEVITYSQPNAVEQAPDWMMGTIPWRGWSLPLFSFSILVGQAREESYTNARIAVLRSLGGDEKMPFLGLLAQGFPRLTTITPEVLIPSEDGVDEPAVRCQVVIRDDLAVVPDLHLIEGRIRETLAA